MFQDTQPAPLPAEGGREAWSDFRVAHPGEMLALLRQLRDGDQPVQLSAPSGAAMGSALWSLDAQRRQLVFSIDERSPSLEALVSSDELVAVAYLDSVKLQFDLHDPVLVRGQGSAALRTGFPQAIYRFQRRSAYRVRTLERSSPTAHLRHPAIPDMVLPLRVIDVSIGGCALLLGHDVPALQPGTRVGGVRIELDADTRFDAGLQLQHVTEIQPGSQGLRIGCAFVALAPAAERQLQRYIDQTQKRRRLLSLG
jgi:c-di-GMP-binding flagellar brake protein YcgR